MECTQTVANGLSFHISQTVAPDTPEPVPVHDPNPLAALPGLQVINATANALQVDAGTAAPNGGGFEVRRRDGGFGTVPSAGSVEADLVVRSPVRNLTIPRLGFAERFYVRIYDGGSPANYSAISAVLVTHLPTA